MSSHRESALEVLVKQSLAMRIETIPAHVRHEAKLCILDTLGCMLAGSRTQEATLMLACEPNQAASAASVIGTAHKRPMREAMRLNAYLGDVLELNDLIGGHASIGTVAAALSLGELEACSGEKLLEAVVRGIEITTRVYEAVYPSLRRYSEMGMVPVGFPSTLGVAAAASHLLNLSAEQTLHALAISGSLAGWCPAEVIFGNGGSVKPLLFGAQPADVGVTAAYYARAGMTGPLDILDSKVGYFASASTQGSFEPNAWENRWALEQPRRKLHACCGYLHAPVDALVQLRTQLGASAFDQTACTVYVAPYVAEVVSKERLPNAPNDARFHLQYCLALTSCGADVILPEHSIHLAEQLQRTELLQAMQTISVVHDSSLEHYHHCRVEVLGAQGAMHSVSITAPRGATKQSLPEPAVLNKFTLLAEPVLGPHRSQQALARILSIDTVEDVRTLMSAFVH